MSGIVRHFEYGPVPVYAATLGYTIQVAVWVGNQTSPRGCAVRNIKTRQGFERMRPDIKLENCAVIIRSAFDCRAIQIAAAIDRQASGRLRSVCTVKNSESGKRICPSGNLK